MNPRAPSRADVEHCVDGAESRGGNAESSVCNRTPDPQGDHTCGMDFTSKTAAV